MSKKLLMNNSSGGLMPVQDGLVCWLDGRDGRDGDIVWKDRSGNGNDAELKYFDFTINNWVENSLRLDGKSYCNLKNLENTMYSEYTFELKMRNLRYGTFGILSNRTTPINGFSLFKMGNSLNLDINYDNAQQRKDFNILLENFIITITISSNGKVETYIDGKFKAEFQYFTKGCGFPYSIKTWTLGAFGGVIGNPCIGDISYFRVYSKLLSPIEIKQNYEYEKSIQRG